MLRFSKDPNYRFNEWFSNHLFLHIHTLPMHAACCVLRLPLQRQVFRRLPHFSRKNPQNAGYLDADFNALQHFHETLRMPLFMGKILQLFSSCFSRLTISHWTELNGQPVVDHKNNRLSRYILPFIIIITNGGSLDHIGSLVAPTTHRFHSFPFIYGGCAVYSHSFARRKPLYSDNSKRFVCWNVYLILMYTCYNDHTQIFEYLNLFNALGVGLMALRTEKWEIDDTIIDTKQVEGFLLSIRQCGHTVKIWMISWIILAIIF